VIESPREWLSSHVNLEAGIGRPVSVRRATAPTLTRIRALLDLLGSPEREFPVVHLTGTNGKTSTSRMISALLES
jgi:dihydrofolate synthase/folylpolyglutamate synthase